jgi:hypothetical protein
MPRLIGSQQSHRKVCHKSKRFKEAVWEILRVHDLRIKGSQWLKDFREFDHPYRYHRANDSGYMVGTVVTHDSDYFSAVAYRQIDREVFKGEAVSGLREICWKR